MSGSLACQIGTPTRWPRSTSHVVPFDSRTNTPFGMLDCAEAMVSHHVAMIAARMGSAALSRLMPYLLLEEVTRVSDRYGPAQNSTIALALTTASLGLQLVLHRRRPTC